MEKVKITYSSMSFAILFVLALMLFYFTRYIVIISILGIGLGVLIVPVLGVLHHKFRLPKSVSALIVFLGIILLILAVLASLYALLADQLTTLAERWPIIQENLKNWALHIFDRYPWIKSQLGEFEIGNYVRNGLLGIFEGLKGGFYALSAGVFVLVIGLYTAVNGKEYFASILGAFVPRHRKTAKMVLEDCAHVLRGWFKAQLIDMAIIGILTAVGLFIAGSEYWAVFGLLTSVLGIIPYVGIILVVIAAILITLASDPSSVPWVLLVFLITQQLEGNLILPMVMKGEADLPVVPLLIFMMFLGAFFGVVGVFMAPPLMAILRALYLDLYLPRINRPA